MWKDFKEFAMRGNVVDLAVGVIIGTAFSKIVSSLVDSIIMPLLGIFIKDSSLAHLSFKIGNAKIMYGQFLQAVFDFLIIAFSIFMMIRLIMKLKKNHEETEEEVAEVSGEELLLTEIRDILRQQQANEKTSYED